MGACAADVAEKVPLERLNRFVLTFVSAWPAFAPHFRLRFDQFVREAAQDVVAPEWATFVALRSFA